MGIFNQIVQFQNGTPYHYDVLRNEEKDDTRLDTRKMTNLVGLEDGRWFKIINIGDGSVIEVTEIGRGKKLVLISRPEDQTKEEYQRFRSILQPSGKFCITSKYQPTSDVLMVWDYSLYSKKLSQVKKKSSDRNNQSWESVKVPGMESRYFILSSVDGTTCLRNMGVGKQIHIVEKTAEITADCFAHWTLEQMGPIHLAPQTS